MNSLNILINLYAYINPLYIIHSTTNPGAVFIKKPRNPVGSMGRLYIYLPSKIEWDLINGTPKSKRLLDTQVFLGVRSGTVRSLEISWKITYMDPIRIKPFMDRNPCTSLIDPSVGNHHPKN